MGDGASDGGGVVIRLTLVCTAVAVAIFVLLWMLLTSVAQSYLPDVPVHVVPATFVLPAAPHPHVTLPGEATAYVCTADGSCVLCEDRVFRVERQVAS